MAEPPAPLTPLRSSCTASSSIQWCVVTPNPSRYPVSPNASPGRNTRSAQACCPRGDSVSKISRGSTRFRRGALNHAAVNSAHGTARGASLTFGVAPCLIPVIVRHPIMRLAKSLVAEKVHNAWCSLTMSAGHERVLRLLAVGKACLSASMQAPLAGTGSRCASAASVE